jgi:hypothetical protein
VWRPVQQYVYRLLNVGDWSGLVLRKTVGREEASCHVYEVDFMVKLLRACVWMPWRNQAKKDAISCDKPREAANRL